MENQLQQLIDWLIHFEGRAAVIFNDLAEALKEDEILSAFLRQLAEDERAHCDCMRNAAAEMENLELEPPPITLDDETREKMEAPFAKIDKMLSTKNLSKETVIECMIETEFSEYNDFFLFAMESLQKDSKEIQHAAAMIDKHRLSIEEFLGFLPEGERYIEKIKALSPIWKAKMLIVENDRITAKLLSSVLKCLGQIEFVANGEEGLRKMAGNYYDAIITDYEMPVMDGIGFYKKAAIKDPDIKSRFVFFSGRLTAKEIDFIQSEGVKYLVKPSSVKLIKETVAGVLG